MTKEEGKVEDPSQKNLVESFSNVKIIRSEELMQGAREICIDHEGEIYRLRLTRNQKLILQK